jgi:hypothetical protein
VFEGFNVVNAQKCVIKVLKPVKKKKVRRFRSDAVRAPGAPAPPDAAR